MSEERGLYSKYVIRKADGSPVEGDYFVLRPGRDAHARAALRAYAESIANENPWLSRDLFRWLLDIDANTQEHRRFTPRRADDDALGES